MNRRTFIGACAAVAGSTTLASTARAAEVKPPVGDKSLQHAKLRIAVPPGIYGDKISIDEKLDRIAAWGAAGKALPVASSMYIAPA